jgi:DNA-binding CsgD family transcriptional regulator
MPQAETSNLQFSRRVEGGRSCADVDIVRPSVDLARAVDESGAEMARRLNGPLSALQLYMLQIKRHSELFSQPGGNRPYLQEVVENALQQAARICVTINQINRAHDGTADARADRAGPGERAAQIKEVGSSCAAFKRRPGHNSLTKRESEVLHLISEGLSNKQGALRMGISPRTFESHRAAIMRKFAARNTADLVRLTLTSGVAPSRGVEIDLQTGADSPLDADCLGLGLQHQF